MALTPQAAPEGGGFDIFAGQGVDERVLAELYDLEHDEASEDLAFYREWARRTAGAVIDLGCGSGRLFAAFLEGGARRIVGVDGARALLERAERRIASDPRLAAAQRHGRIHLVRGDVRDVEVAEGRRFGLAVLAGVLSHLDGAPAARRALASAGRLLDENGTLIVDMLGPGGLPTRDLPLSVDWERTLDGRRIVRRSRIDRVSGADGLRVKYSTITELSEPDGTIARLPASFRLWYPSPSALFRLADEAGLAVEATFGSHDLDRLDAKSDRCIAVMRHATATPGRG